MDKITKPWTIKEPWSLNINEDIWNSIYQGDHKNVKNQVALVRSDEEAEYICLAVNNHERLVEALKVIKLRTNSIQMDDITSQVFSINNIAEEALKAVDGEGVK